MSAESVLETWFAAGDAGDFDVFDEVLHRDVVVHAPMGLSTVGAEAQKDVWRDALRAMPGIRHELREIVVAGDTIAARAVVSGTLHGDFAWITGSGQRFEVDQALFAHPLGAVRVVMVRSEEVAELVRGEHAGFAVSEAATSGPGCRDRDVPRSEPQVARRATGPRGEDNS